MSAGRTFQHEEEAPPAEEPLHALQIFMRPRTAGLEPQVQFHDFGAVYSRDAWRLLSGPAHAPLILRADAWIHDARLSAGASLELPEAPSSAVARLLYAFAGRATVAGITLMPGESVLLHGEEYAVLAEELSDLVLFTTDMAAPVFKGGMFSGNLLRA